MLNIILLEEIITFIFIYQLIGFSKMFKIILLSYGSIKMMISWTKIYFEQQTTKQ